MMKNEAGKGGLEAVQPPLPFTLSLPVGGCGHGAQREAAASGGGE